MTTCGTMQTNGYGCPLPSGHHGDCKQTPAPAAPARARPRAARTAVRRGADAAELAALCAYRTCVAAMSGVPAHDTVIAGAEALAMRIARRALRGEE